jgi:hypothetical protein
LLSAGSDNPVLGSSVNVYRNRLELGVRDLRGLNPVTEDESRKELEYPWLHT